MASGNNRERMAKMINAKNDFLNSKKPQLLIKLLSCFVHLIKPNIISIRVIYHGGILLFSNSNLSKSESIKEF